MNKIPNFPTIQELLQAYFMGDYSPVDVIKAIYQKIRLANAPEIWISMADESLALNRAAELVAYLDKDPAMVLDTMPLLGIPFAVKDNIDVLGLATTAGCPDFAYTPIESANVVQRLESAGAILIGKTNLDQFATGLVGTRSPYGIVRNPFNPAYISGGSSSGSAAAVAHGFVAFSLGTDTAGSGRVPAGLCNLVGIKPSPGLVSTHGIVPACRSLDCVSVFSHTVDDGWRVLSLIAGMNATDPYSRVVAPLGSLPRSIRIGVPDRLEFFGDTQAEIAFSASLNSLSKDTRVTIKRFPLKPFQEIALLLYDGPWLSERRATLGDFFEQHGEAMDPVVRGVIARAAGQSATDAFLAFYKLEEFKHAATVIFADIDMMLVPTVPTHYTIQEIAAEPFESNSRLGTYTNFVNLLGMCAVALPGGFRADGLPAGVTLIGPAGADYRLAEFARSLEPVLHHRLGCSASEPPRCDQLFPLPKLEPTTTLVVVGAHLSGQALNWQLLELGARLLRTARTAPLYRMYVLANTTPTKPGLLRVPKDGVSIEVELWEMPTRLYGTFVANIPAPLGMGMLELDDGSQIQGFLCEAWAVASAQDISKFGGWRSYRAQPGAG